MPLIVFVAVLAGAILHAGWNAIVKSAGEKMLTTILITTTAAVIAAAALPLLKSPVPSSLSYAALSAVFQIIYFVVLTRAYHSTDMSQSYPLMRGSAPVLVAVVSAWVLGERLSAPAWVGVLAVCCGIIAMAATSRSGDPKGVRFALLNGVVIACYTLIDGLGVRHSGAPAAYTAWVVLFTGLPLSLWGILRNRGRFVPYLRQHWPVGVAGGLATTLSYGVALWAMTLAPIAVVAALRETSILFGTLIAGVVLRERIGPLRIASACMIAVGAIALRLA
jgi:drug/metabolite transporter (DMT)-like permease